MHFAPAPKSVRPPVPSPVRPSGAPSAFVRARKQGERETSRRPSAGPSHRTRKGSPIAQCTFDAHVEREERILLLLNVRTSGITGSFPPEKQGRVADTVKRWGNSGTVAEFEAHCIECVWTRFELSVLLRLPTSELWIPTVTL